MKGTMIRKSLFNKHTIGVTNITQWKAQLIGFGCFNLYTIMERLRIKLGTDWVGTELYEHNTQHAKKSEIIRN